MDKERNEILKMLSDFNAQQMVAELAAHNAAMMKKFEEITRVWNQDTSQQEMESALWRCIRIAESTIATYGATGKAYMECFKILQETTERMMQESADDVAKIHDLCGKLEDAQDEIRTLRYQLRKIGGG